MLNELRLRVSDTAATGTDAGLSAIDLADREDELSDWLIEHEIDTPRVCFTFRWRESTAHGFVQRQGKKGFRHILLDKSDAQAARAGDFPG